VCLGGFVDIEALRCPFLLLRCIAVRSAVGDCACSLLSAESDVSRVVYFGHQCDGGCKTVALGGRSFVEHCGFCVVYLCSFVKASVV